MVKKEQTKMEKIKESLDKMQTRLKEMNEKSLMYMREHPVTMKTAGYLGTAIVGGIIGFALGKKKRK